MLHLHRLEHEERRAARDGLPGFHMHGNDAAGHRCHETERSRFGAIGEDERLALEAIGDAGEEQRDAIA